MQLKEFDEQQTDHCSSLKALDNHDFDMEPQKLTNSSQLCGSCCFCVQGHPSIIKLGLQNCSISASSINGHKGATCEDDHGGPFEGVCQDRLVDSRDDRCTCNEYAGVSYSNSVSSVGSSLAMFDDELHLPDVAPEIDHDKDSQLSQSCASRVEDLQLDLLECALEYEVKILEMKMKMVQMRSNNEDPVPGLKIHQSIQKSSTQQPELPAVSGQLEKLLAQRLDTCRKKMNRLQNQRDSLAKELSDFRKKQRKFELQRKNMEDLLRRVNNLQRKLTKREEEMMECQLKEKEAKARLHDLQAALQRSKAKNYEPEQLVKLIPSLRTWLRSLKKSVPIKGNHRQLLQVEQFEAVLGRILENAPQELLKRQSRVGARNAKSTLQSPIVEHSTPVDCIREVYELQKELQRLAIYR